MFFAISRIMGVMQTETQEVAISDQLKFSVRGFFDIFPHTFMRWQELYIYFWVFSGVGHYAEILAGFLSLTGSWHPKMPTLTPIAPPYGFGVVAAILLVVPLKEKYKLSPAWIFVLGTAVMMLVEMICGAVIVLVVGYNPFWDYKAAPFNIFGLTCLGNGLLFGVLALMFVYVFYPLFEKFLQALGSKKVNLIFWILAVSYGFDLLHTTVTNGWLKK